jgi:long-chain fatty acid transport protein
MACKETNRELMRKRHNIKEAEMFKRGVFFTALALVTALASPAFATNGDNLIGIGPISRAMGGVGVAAPQDAISAVFANPAGMCFSSYCNAQTFDFAGTLFMPKVDTKVTTAYGTYSADSRDTIYGIPAIGISVPMAEPASAWRFGLAAYGVSGLGVDYRGTDIDQGEYANFGGFPLIQGEYTSLMIMKFAPTVAFQATDKISVGASLQIDYSTLDLRDGSSPNYGYGFQVGVLYAPIDSLKLGASYTNPQSVNYKSVNDFMPFGTRDNLELQSPQQLNLGVACTLYKPMEILVETDAKWINWSDAKGYEDFDWNDQMVYAIGIQAKPVKNLTVRAGFNYGKNPVEEHDGFDGSNPMVNGRMVQGSYFPTYYYETFRVIGFPAVVEKHYTFGVGYAVTPKLTVNAGLMIAPEVTISETGTDLAGNPVSLESTLSESSYDFGLTWNF